MNPLVDFIKPFVPYIVVAIVFFLLGYWMQDGKVEVKEIPAVKYLPNPEGYVDLPDYSMSPVVEYVFTRPESAGRDTVFRVDSIFVPVSYDRYRLLTNESVRMTDEKLYLSVFDPFRKDYVLQEYDVPEPTFTYEWHFMLGAALGGSNIANVAGPGIASIERVHVYPVFGTGITGWWRRWGISADVYMYEFGEYPIGLVGINYAIGGK